MTKKADAIDLQRAEFDAVGKLATEYKRIQFTPIVDDDYPAVRHDYEGAMRDTVRALISNGRLQPNVGAPTWIRQYQDECQRTKSPAFYGENVSRRIFVERACTAIAALAKLDEVKKALFYNKPAPHLKPAEYEMTAFTLQLHNLHNLPQGGIDILHAIIGKATEAGELLELLMNSLATPGVPFDQTNFVEEIGDGFWYDSIGLEAVGSNFDDATNRNNRKLRTRFPDKFNEAEAVTRNLGAERTQLETTQAASERHFNERLSSLKDNRTD